MDNITFYWYLLGAFLAVWIVAWVFGRIRFNRAQDDYESERRLQESALARTNTELTDIRSRLDEQRSLAETLAADKNDLSNQLSVSTESLEASLAATREHERQLAELAATRSELERALADRDGELEARHAELGTMRTQLDELAERLESTRADLDAKRAALAGLETEVENQRREADELRELIRVREEQIEALEQELDEQRLAVAVGGNGEEDADDVTDDEASEPARLHRP